MTMTVRWPDGRVEDCYSPSLVLHDHLTVGERYTVADFASRSRAALAVASERVRQKYGFACTSAAATTQQITESATAFGPDDVVEVVRMWPPLPAPTTQEAL